MKTPHKSQAAAMDRAGELPDGEQSMSMFASREDFDTAVRITALEKAVDHAHEILRRQGYHRDGDHFVNVNLRGAEAMHVITIAMIADAALGIAPLQAEAVAHQDTWELPPLPRPDVVSSDEDFAAYVHSYSEELLEEYAMGTVHINTSKLASALAAERAEAVRLREALIQGEALINGDLTGLEWKVECRKFLVAARAALGLYQGEANEHK